MASELSPEFLDGYGSGWDDWVEHHKDPAKGKDPKGLLDNSFDEKKGESQFGRRLSAVHFLAIKDSP